MVMGGDAAAGEAGGTGRKSRVRGGRRGEESVIITEGRREGRSRSSSQKEDVETTTLKRRERGSSVPLWHGSTKY
jgi:hypothetical protein